MRTLRRCTGACGGANWATPTHAWCKPCQNAHKRRSRRPYSAYTDAEKQRHRARIAAAQARKRGDLTPTPCPCGCATFLELLEMHHEDYSRPLDVEFLCHDEHLRRDRLRLARLARQNDQPESSGGSEVLAGVA